MKISEVIRKLNAIKEKFGDIAVTGAYMSDDTPLRSILVTDDKGMEVWPGDPNNVAGRNKIDGVFFQC